MMMKATTTTAQTKPHSTKQDIFDKHPRFIMSSSSIGVQVVVRLRPLNDREKKHGTLPVISASTNDKTVTVIKGTGSRQGKTY